MDHQRTRKSRLLAAGALVGLALLLILVAASAWKASQPPLVRYVTPPLDEHGTRLSLLVPRGWHVTRLDGVQSIDMADTMLMFRAMPWLPIWLRARLMPVGDTNAQMVVHWIRGSRFANQDAVQTGLMEGLSTATRERNVPGRGWWLMSYSRSDARAFRATYQAIRESVKIE